MAMAAAGDALERALRRKTREYMALCVYDSARFLAERLVAHVRETRALVAAAASFSSGG